MLILSPLDFGNPGKFVVEALTASHMVKSLLPMSNLLRLDGAINLFIETLATVPCYQLAGGSLDTRIEFLNTLL